MSNKALEESCWLVEARAATSNCLVDIRKIEHSQVSSCGLAGAKAKMAKMERQHSSIVLQKHQKVNEQQGSGGILLARGGESSNIQLFGRHQKDRTLASIILWAGGRKGKDGKDGATTLKYSPAETSKGQ